VPIWLDADEQFVPNESVHRLVIAQDTGGAIKGPVRGDLFWGTGGVAGDRAGEMDARGRYYLLLPRSLAVRLSAEESVADGRRIDLPRMQCLISGACDRE
jgi:membrane-bound lytic murein transglycosylase A